MRLAVWTPPATDADYGARALARFESLAAPLRAAGLDPVPVLWTEPLPAGVEAVCPLLAWGYHCEAPLWRERLEQTAQAGVRLVNPLDVLLWNTRKTYLAELAAAGAPVVPTVFVDRLAPHDVEAARHTLDAEVLVAKPQISAGARQTVRLAPGDALSDAPDGPAMLQPFLPAVADEGELSLLYFGGRFSHAVRKVAQGGDFRVQPQFGSALEGFTPDAQACTAAEAVLTAAARPLTYARIDLIRGLDGRLQLMELEAIEPDLFLEFAPDGGAAFAAAVKAAL